tara:strand:+ start:51364 stop:51927 length:564 start_codon:yes stop_codon:yes gene_type:complete
MTHYSSVYRDRGIWEHWHDKEFSDYKGKEVQFIEPLVSEETKKNVILYGNNGTGKSMLMNIALKNLLHRGKEVYVIDFRMLVNEYVSSWGRSDLINHILTVDYLGIDDLGKEYNISDNSKELAVTTLDFIMRYRYQRELSTWLTFNFGLKDIKPVYGEHLASLLKRNTIAVTFDGSDYGDNLFKKAK